MPTLPRQETVLLSEKEGGSPWLEKMAGSLGEARHVESIAELVHRALLPSVAVLVLDCRPAPSGQLLAAVGRLNVEYPGIQKLALLSEDPPLEVATYLTSCGVDILLDQGNEEVETGGPLAAVIDRLRERARWFAS